MSVRGQRRRPRRAPWLGGVAVGVLGLALAASVRAAGPAAAGGGRTVVEVEGAKSRIADVRAVLDDAEKVAASAVEKTPEELAERLVAGQLMLVEHDTERAAIVFLDLLENHTGTPAAAQARYFLGEALARLHMSAWAKESFQANLADGSADGRRYHQHSLAGLLGLASPAREVGFARRPGLSATPELRGRLRAIGIDVSEAPRAGILDQAELQATVTAVEAIPAAQRKPLLRYAYGRHLYLVGQLERAREELDALAPPTGEPPAGKKARAWHIRAGYVAAAAVLAAGEHDAALERFGRIASVRTDDPQLGQVIDLSWMAQGRIHHDRFETEQAVRAYRRVSRDSAYFPEAMYETAWTLLRAGNYDRAVGALDLLLDYDPESPLVPEIQSLRGKVKIQQRDWAGADEEFTQLRRRFADLSGRVGHDAELWSDAARYFSAVVAEDLEHFTFASVVPVEAVQVAKSLPRAVHGQDLAQLVGELERDLTDTRALLSRMEEAVRASERARLFNDLSARLASVDNAASELVELKEDLITRARMDLRGAGIQELEEKRRALRQRVDTPVADGVSRADMDKAVRALEAEAKRSDLMIAALRAQLVAAERYYAGTRDKQRIDPKGFLTQAGELRESIGELERDVKALREKIERTQTTMRFNDPWQRAWRASLADYSEFLDGMYAAIVKVDPRGELGGLWDDIGALETRTVAARSSLDAAAGRRLERAIAVLVEERANLDKYLVEMQAQVGATRDLVGSVMQAALQDVAGELRNLVMRSEVGLLDVAWAVQEEEINEIQRLETIRDRDMREIERALDQGLEEVGR